MEVQKRNDFYVYAYTGEVVHKTQNEMVEDHGVTIAPISMVASGIYM